MEKHWSYYYNFVHKKAKAITNNKKNSLKWGGAEKGNYRSLIYGQLM